MKSEEEIIKEFLSIDEQNLTNGKYGAKSANFYEEVSNAQKGKLCDKYEIKPIQFTFEITNLCNCSCPHCGMSANKKSDKSKLNLQELSLIADELEKGGIISYAITGGEPFLEFENMCKFINSCQGKLDAIKLISNGFWGKDAKYYFKKLEEAGLFKNRFVIPSLQLSIGEQQVPLEYICNIIHYVAEHFTGQQLHLGIINTKSKMITDKLERLYQTYTKNFGDFPKHRVYLTMAEYKIYVEGQGERLEIESDSVYDEIGNCDNTFCQELGMFVSPKIFMKVNGDCYPCEIFNIHEQVKLGNLFTDGIEEILKNYNSNKYVSFIKNFGTAMFREVIPERILKNQSAQTPCMACEFCIKYCAKNNLII